MTEAPTPNTHETLLWGEPREVPVAVSKLKQMLMVWPVQIFNLLVLAYLLRQAWETAARDETGAVDVFALISSIFGPAAIGFGIVIAVFIIGKYFNLGRFFKRSQATPHWLSQERLAYVPAGTENVTTVPISDILSAKLDYYKGSLALRLQTATETLNLLSSDAENLQRKFYTLRPDLEPTS